MFNPSNPIESFRVSNLHIVDDGNIFSSNFGGLLGTQINSLDYKVLSNNIKLFLFTSVGERNDWKYSNLSLNEIAVFVFKNAGKLLLHIKLSDNLLPLSRFKSKTEMLDFEVAEEEFIFRGKTLSIDFLLRFFDTVEEPLFNIISKADLQLINKKSIRILKKGDLKPIQRNPVEGKLNVTIGLFFDGTGNNKFNTKLVHDHIVKKVYYDEIKGQNTFFSDYVDKFFNDEKARNEENKEFEEFMFEPKSSYLNDYTNIVKLYDLYKEVDLEDEIITKFYIEGIGTKQKEKDSNFGTGFGRDSYTIVESLFGAEFKVVPYGVTSRCIEAIKKISNYLINLQKKESKEIEEVVFDIFGFSRGAAAARLLYRKIFMDNIFNHENIKNSLKINSYKIRFYGLFDTVLSFSDTNNEDISLRTCESPCYHIIAQDEIRKNFPLTNIASKNKVELELFGCHSDIGGSYTRDKFFASFAFDESEKSEPTNNLKKLFCEYKLKYAVDTSKKYFRYFTNQITVKLLQSRFASDTLPNNQIYKEQNVSHIFRNKNGYIAEDNRIIESDISKVSLQAMLLFASQHNLPFNDYDFNYDLSPKLTFDDKNLLIQYKDSVKSLIDKINDYSEKTPKFTEKNLFDLYHKFVHISESYNYHIFSKYESKINELGNLLYSDGPTNDRIRVEYFRNK